MRRNSTIFLVPTQIEKDNIGNEIEIFGQPRKILADRKSVRQTEFYQAATTDFKPEMVFTVWPHEYEGEKYLRYQNQLFYIVRTFEKNFRELELVCEVKISDKNKRESIK